MSSGKRRDFEDLLDESEGFRKRLDALDSLSSSERAGLINGLHAWVRECLAHGRYFPTGSPERRALRGLVEEWNFRLQRGGHHLHGTDELAPYDPTAGVVLDSECPYPGLDAYRADRSGSFFGR